MAIFKKISYGGLLLWLFLGICPKLGAQLLERPDNPALKPLNFGLVVQSDDIAVSPDDRWVVVNDGSSLVIIDSADFDLAQTQPEELDSRAESYEFLPNSVSLFAVQNDGLITRILADDPLNDVLNVDVSADIQTGNFNMVMDPESIDNHLFVLNFSNNTIYEYNIRDQNVPNSVLIDPPDGFNSVNDMIYVALPASVVGDTGGEIDKIFIPTNDGQLLIFSEQLNFTAALSLTGENEDCPTNGNPDDNVIISGAINTDRSLLFALNTSDSTVHVVDTITEVELDTDSNQNGINPICLKEFVPGEPDLQDINENIRNIAVNRVQDPANASRGLITGDLGVTVINTTRGDFGVVDQDPGTDPTDNIVMSANPDRITKSSQSDGYFYITNINGTISVISAKPFVTIQSVDPDTLTQGDPDFAITFQVDELCDGCAYRIRANGDIDESGTLLLETTYSSADQANVDLSTPTLNINDFTAGTFIEGQNRIFIFSEDADGLVGRDSIFVNVDQPPTDVEILKVEFGNTRGYVTFTRLTQEDISQYNIFVLEALDQNNPECPGGLDFSAAAPTASVGQTGGGDTIRATLTGLTNGVAYCVGVQAEDSSGNTSPNIALSPTVLIPELTVGILGLSGETGGCQLGKSSSGSGVVWLLSLGLWVYLPLRLRARHSIRFMGLLLILFLSTFGASTARAYEVTDQHWSAQVQGGFFLPTDDVLDQFLGKCCNGMYNFTFGRLWDSKYEVNLGIAFMVENRQAVGADTERVSGESFNFFVLPISNSFVYRADYLENQVLVPYVSVGFDYMFFRENLQGDVTTGWKFGYHAAGGLQILLEWFDRSTDALEDYGINDVYLTLEGKWQQIDNFGGAGLAFNGFTFSAGLLFEF